MISKFFAVASQIDPVDLGFHTLWDRPGCFCWHLMLVYHQKIVMVVWTKENTNMFWTHFDVWVFKRFRIVLETILPEMDLS